MITTVNPCVAVNDGVSDFGPKVHLRGVKAQYTQTWWIQPPPFLMKGLIAYSWMPMFFFLAHVIYPLHLTPGLTEFCPKCQTSDVVRTSDASDQTPTRNHRT